MSEKIKILNIARNIPVPGINENDILIRLFNAVLENDFIMDIWFPKELIFPFPFLEGREKAISKLPKVFESKNHKISSINYIRLPSVSFSYLLLNSFFLFNRKKITESKQFNLIHAHTLMPDGYIGLKIKDKYNIPLIVTMRNGDLDKLSRLKKNSILHKKYTEVLLKADRVVVHNYATEKHVKSLEISPLKIPHGIEKTIFREFEKRDTKKIIIISQLIRRKNVDWLIEAFKRISHSSWELHIVGDGNYKDKLLLIADKNENITFHGKLDRVDAIELLSKSDIFVMPSDNETFGLAYLEAAANSCALIGKRYTGIYGWLEEDKEALFVESIDELEFKLKKLMLDKSYRYSLAQTAFNKVTTEMTWEEQVNKYINEYIKISK